MPFNRTTPAGAIVAAHGAPAGEFQKHGSDYLCRSSSTMFVGCEERHFDPEEVFAELENAIAPPAGHILSDHLYQVPDPDFIAHIVEHHHAYVRHALPYILVLLARVAGFHGKRNPKLNSLYEVGQELADTLEAHLEKEERELFPALLAALQRAAVLRELEEIDRHHRDVLRLLARVRSLADDYAAPDWGDRSYHALMEELEGLDEKLTEHMHLENYIFIPEPSLRSQEAY